jgi:hypothetical protein
MRSTDSCLLELRDRLAAAEQRISELEGEASEHSKSAHFCFEAIIQRVEALEAATNLQQQDENVLKGARAAILAVAEWFDAIDYGAAASILRQEVERHG